MMSPADGNPGPATGAARVGAELRAARQRLGWALPDVSATLRIRLPFLEAIEDGRIADLPGNTYAVGFIRTYASSLGLDAAEIARRFRAESSEVNRKTELAFPAPVPQRGVPVGAVVLLGLLLTGGAYVGWFRMSGETRTSTEAVPAVPDRLAPLADRAAPPSNPSPQVASILPPPAAPPASAARQAAPAALAATPPIPPPAPVPAAASPPAPSPPAPSPPATDAPRVLIRLTSDAWVQVRERQGQVLLSRVMRGGETWPVPRGAKLLMTTGNAGGTELVMDGVAGPSLGPAGAVRRDVPVDGDAVQPADAAPQTGSQ
jgi:cytoskeleton protein RodZ